MNKYSCLIVDDEQLARELLEAHIAKIPCMEIVAVFADAINAKLYLQQHTPDIMLLDINMPGLSGIELLRILKSKPATIITTAHSDHSLESYELDVVDYILKPIEFERFFKAATKAMEWIDYGRDSANKLPPVSSMEHSKPYFFVKANYKIVKVVFDEILFVEALEKYVRIHTIAERIITLISISHLEKLLPNNNFIRIHRSYIVNLDKINSIEGNIIRIGKQELPVSKGQKEELLRKINIKGE